MRNVWRTSTAADFAVSARCCIIVRWKKKRVPKEKLLSAAVVRECTETAVASVLHGKGKEKNCEDNENFVSEGSMDKRNAWRGSICTVLYVSGIDR